MEDDAVRVLQFKMQQSAALRHTGLEVDHGVGLLAATTWRDDYARWFTTREVAPSDPTAGAFGRLSKVLPPETIWNAYALSDGRDHAGVRQTHWLLYALFPLSTVALTATPWSPEKSPPEGSPSGPTHI